MISRGSHGRAAGAECACPGQLGCALTPNSRVEPTAPTLCSALTLDKSRQAVQCCRCRVVPKLTLCATHDQETVALWTWLIPHRPLAGAAVHARSHAVLARAAPSRGTGGELQRLGGRWRGQCAPYLG